MPHMVVTLDTSHLEMSPLNLFAPGTGLYFPSKKNPLISLTAETSQEPIGPCQLSEQSVDSFRHSLMAAWSSALDFETHPVVGYYNRGDTVGRTDRVTMMIRITDNVFEG